MTDTLDALKRAISALETTVGVLKESVSSLQKSVDLISDALFGVTDPRQPLKSPIGLRDIVNRHETTIRRALYGGGAALLFLVLHSAGVPTELIWKTLAAAFGLPHER